MLIAFRFLCLPLRAGTCSCGSVVGADSTAEVEGMADVDAAADVDAMVEGDAAVKVVAVLAKNSVKKSTGADESEFAVPFFGLSIRSGLKLVNYALKFAADKSVDHNVVETSGTKSSIFT
ncbi:hypothetical protein C8R46DRAFT_1046858 [Mycena filopes]|nr:hypothetical protein C8R46DRAFT_1046858 [Mycena filopes]